MGIHHLLSYNIRIKHVSEVNLYETETNPLPILRQHRNFKGFDKNIRLLSGHYYRLYFRNVANLSGEEKVTPDLLAYEELSLNEDVSPKNS